MYMDSQLTLLKEASGKLGGSKSSSTAQRSKTDLPNLWRGVAVPSGLFWSLSYRCGLLSIGLNDK